MANTLPTRNADGMLPAYAWPGGYPVLYLDNLNDTLCAECASKTSDTAACFVHYEGPAEECAECGDLVASAYGDPNDAEDNRTVNTTLECEGL
jgi:hypothetical protein